MTSPGKRLAPALLLFADGRVEDFYTVVDEGPTPDEGGGRTCVVCGADISHRRADATTCGNSCRARKSRKVALDEPEDDDAWTAGPPYVVEAPQLVLSEQVERMSHILDRFEDLEERVLKLEGIGEG